MGSDMCREFREILQGGLLYDMQLVMHFWSESKEEPPQAPSGLPNVPTHDVAGEQEPGGGTSQAGELQQHGVAEPRQPGEVRHAMGRV